MLGKKTQLMIIASLLLSFTLGLCLGAGGMVMATRSVKTKDNTQPAKRIIVVAIKQNQWEQLFEQLQIFADQQGFAIRIAPTTPNGDFVVQMWREDIKGIGVNSSDPGVVKIAFYDTNPAHPSPKWAFDELVSDLRNLISEIPNVTITEGK
jgi:hypothetical protein